MKELADIFDLLMRQGILPTAFAIGVISFLLAVIGKLPIGQGYDISTWARIVVGCFGLTLTIVSLGGVLVIGLSVVQLQTPTPTAPEYTSVVQTTITPEATGVTPTRVDPTASVPPVTPTATESSTVVQVTPPAATIVMPARISPTTSVPPSPRQVVSESDVPEDLSWDFEILPHTMHMITGGDYNVGGYVYRSNSNEIHLVVLYSDDETPWNYTITGVNPRQNWHGVYTGITDTNVSPLISEKIQALERDLNSCGSYQCDILNVVVIRAGNIVERYSRNLTS